MVNADTRRDHNKYQVTSCVCDNNPETLATSRHSVLAEMGRSHRGLKSDEWLDSYH